MMCPGVHANSHRRACGLPSLIAPLEHRSSQLPLWFGDPKPKLACA